MTLDSPPALSVVVPAYRAADTLPVLTAQLVEALKDRGTTFELILVNDASPDDTWKVIDKLSSDDARVVGIDLLHNHGQPLATLCGMSVARGDLVATLDDDLEHPPAELNTLLDAMEANPDWDAVVGSWARQRGFVRNLGTQIHSWADYWAWGTPRSFDHTAFRLLRRPVSDALISHPGRQPVIGPMLLRLAANVHNVSVEHGSRHAGQSAFTVREGIRRVVVNYTSGSTFPLVAMSFVGVLVSILAMLSGAAVFVRWLFGATPPSGWVSTVLATTFLSGVILLSLGILGQYVAFLVREANIQGGWNIRRVTSGLDPRDAP